MRLRANVLKTFFYYFYFRFDPTVLYCWWRWFTIDVPPSSLNLVLRWLLFYLFCSSIVINTVIVTAEPLNRIESGRFGALYSDSTHHFLEMPVPSQGHYGFHSFPVVDWFCLFIYLWVLTFPLEDCSEFGNFVITHINCFTFYYNSDNLEFENYFNM